jgi:hypothetical protein
MKGNYFLKWLLLTVLSVSTLHFRESSNVGQYRIEQTSYSQNIGKKDFLDFKYPPTVRLPAVVCFKNAQYIRLTDLSNSLNAYISCYPELRPDRALGTPPIQNQHFRSRTLSSDDHSISLS